MDTRVEDVINEISTMVFPNDLLLNTVDELLRDYPEFIFTVEMRGYSDMFHDVEKKVTPHGIKNSLNYEWSDFLPALESELENMVEYCNAIKKILCGIKAARNKKLILSVLAKMFGITLSTGGCSSPRVRRIILIYEREGKIKKKRKNNAVDRFDANIFPSTSFIVEELTAKKLKNLDYYPVSPELEEDCREVRSILAEEPTKADLGIDGFDFNLYSDEFDGLFDICGIHEMPFN